MKNLHLELFLVTLGLAVASAIYVDLGSEVPSCSGLGKTYYFMPPGQIEANRISCLIDDPGNTR